MAKPGIKSRSMLSLLALAAHASSNSALHGRKWHHLTHPCFLVLGSRLGSWLCSPEFVFKIRDKDNCHHGQWPRGSSVIRLTTRKDMVSSLGFNAGFTYRKTATKTVTAASNNVEEDAPGVGGWGGECRCPNGDVYMVGDNNNECGALGGAALACVGGTPGICQRYVNSAWKGRRVTCAESFDSTGAYSSSPTGGIEITTSATLTASADAHVLIRTSNSNPFEEAWSYGTVTFRYTFDFLARAWAKGSWTTNPFALLPRTCLPPLCFGGTIAGVGVSFGVSFGLQAQLEADFDAELRVEYSRRVKFVGTILAHTRGSQIKSKTVTGFQPEHENGPENAEPRPPAVTLTIAASATASLIPEVHVGLYGSADFRIIALSFEAAAWVKPKLSFRLGFAFRAALGTTNVLPALPSGGSCDAFSWGGARADCCSGSGLPPICNNQCSSVHDTKIDLNILATFTGQVVLKADGRFGRWTRVVGPYIFPIPVDSLNFNFHLASICLYLFPNPGVKWAIVSGGDHCQLWNSGRCITDGVGPHGHDEACTIQAARPLYATATFFATESDEDLISMPITRVRTSCHSR